MKSILEFEISWKVSFVIDIVIYHQLRIYFFIESKCIRNIDSRR